VTQISPELVSAVHEAVWSRRDAIVHLVLDLVGAESITGNEAAVQDVVERQYAKRGLVIDRWETTEADVAGYLDQIGRQSRYEGRPHLAGTRAGAGGGRSLMLQGHIDTVDFGDTDLWTTSPLGEVVGSRIYGRGAADMKAGVATHIIVLDILDALGITLQGDLVLAASVGEEDGGYGAVATLLRGHRADAALISEPTALDVVIAHGGSLVYRITVHGKSAHGAHRDEGVSAVEKFYLIFQMLLDWEAERNATLSHPLYDHMPNKFPISTGLVRAGTWASTVPEVLVAEGRLGFLPGETIEDMQAETERRIAAIADADDWMREHRPEVEWFGGQFASCEISPDEPIAQTIAKAHEMVSGKRAVMKGITAGLDMRLLINIGGIPTATYGAGDVRFVHCADEWIEIDEILQAIEATTIAAMDWCGIVPEGTPA
jgi:acetylornithine deacetylase